MRLPDAATNAEFTTKFTKFEVDIVWIRLVVFLFELRLAT